MIVPGCIARCNSVKDTLEEVVLIDLPQVTDAGVAYLAGLKFVQFDSTSLQKTERASNV